MIKRLTIAQLYQTYDYDITFPSGQSVTIITGPNGYGKTTILNIIDHLLARNFWYFYFLNFSKITVVFGDDTSLIITRTQKETEDGRDDTLLSLPTKVKFALTGEGIEDFFQIDNAYIAEIEKKLRENDYLFREAKIVDLEELFNNKYSGETTAPLPTAANNTAMFLQELSCLFVKDRRLTSLNLLGGFGDEHFELEITQLADELQQEFGRCEFLYRVKSQQIDASFMERLLSREHEVLSPDAFKKRVEGLKTKMSNLMKYELVLPTHITEDYSEPHVLSLYLEDLESKISVYDDFYKKLSLFDRFISQKQLSNKQVKLKGSRGLLVYNNNGQEIPLAKLSSGEQNLLILYYKLVFTLNSRSILLIDGPENSLHVAWQSQMLADYMRMAEELECQIVVATHSPTFIDIRWDIAYDLFDKSYPQEE